MRTRVGVLARSRRGSARPEFAILLAVMAVGASLSMPRLARFLHQEPLSRGDWVGVGIGLLMILAAAGPFVKWSVGSWMKSRGKR